MDNKLQGLDSKDPILPNLSHTHQWHTLSRNPKLYIRQKSNRICHKIQERPKGKWRRSRLLKFDILTS